jgi:OOP family OmpA-OmpF porin
LRSNKADIDDKILFTSRTHFKKDVHMKKISIATSILLALSTQALADPGQQGDKWIAGFAEYYSTDQEASGFPNYFSDGTGLGAEFGFRFLPQWAGRIEYSSLDINASSLGQDKSGSRFGFDALYFLPNDSMYIFGGVKEIKIADSDTMYNLGLGKQWAVAEKLKVITEVAAYNNFENGNNDIGVKVGLAYTFGNSAPAMPKDSDNDGVNDTLDMCPNTAPGTQVDAKGCDIDEDKDGVLNSLDLCPNTPMGMKVDSNGCEFLDSDSDGVSDTADKCPNTPTTDKVDASGCSMFMEEEVSQSLQFTFANNSSVIVNHYADFELFADFMKRHANADAVIEGHASAPGDAVYNMQLSQKRADAVRQLLITKYGIEAERLSAVGFGETQLLDTANTAAANAKNRRITAKVTASKRIKVEK